MNMDSISFAVGGRSIDPMTGNGWPAPTDLASPLEGTSTHYAPEQRWQPPGCASGPLILALVEGGLAVLVGSGGNAGYLFDRLQLEDFSTSPMDWEDLLRMLKQTTRGDATKGHTSPVFSTADLVAEIKATLGINVTELATIARVSRQTLYDWLDGATASPANYMRLTALRQEVCTVWKDLAKRPVGRLLHARDEHGVSLYELLGQDPLDASAIRVQINKLAAKRTQEEASRQRRRSKIEPLGEQAHQENLLAHIPPATES